MSGEPAPSDLSAQRRIALEALLREQGLSEPEAPAPRRAPHAESVTSFPQERLWFLEQLNPGSATYNVPAIVRLPGPLNVAALERALDEVVRRHEVLRASFATRDGQPVQVVAAEASVPLPLADLRSMPESARELEAQRLVGQELTRPFRLDRAPLVRALLVRLADTDHVLALVMHHTVTDGWSMGIFFEELNALYEAFSAGRESPLPELPLQYADFAHWQRERLRGERLEEQLGYWRPRLADAPAVLELPTDRPRPAAQSFRGGMHGFLVPAALVRRLERLAQGEGATLFMVVLAAFKTLLHRYSGKDDLVVGTPIANRSRVEFERLIGFFVNTLVLRTDCSGDPSYRELLQRVREVTLGAYAHQDLPFEQLVLELQPERRLSHNPLFQVMFVFQSGRAAGAPGADAILGGETSTDEGSAPTVIGLGTSKFDLLLALTPSPDEGLLGALEYSLDLYEPDTAARMAEHLVCLLESVVDDPDRPLSQLELLSPEERRRLLVEWNATARPLPEGTCLHDLFEAQAARTPEALALVAGDERLTYAELDGRAGRLASRLRSLGVGPDVPVGVCLPRTADLVVALLAVLKAGGAYLALDPAYPSERVAFMLADGGAPVVLTNAALEAEHGFADLRAVRLDADAEWIAAAEAQPPPPAVDPDNLVYVLYTSGSTGVPKGSGCTHRGLVNLMLWGRELLSDEELDGLLASSSICFDSSAWELFLPLSFGGTVVLVENALRLDSVPDGVPVRTLNTVPSVVPELLRSGALPETLRTVSLAGEALPARTVRDLHERAGVRVHDFYGLTEASVYSVTALVPPDVEGRTPIGRPVANTQAYVLDRALRPVPVGVHGELHVGGAGLARGYLGRPSLTAERFVPSPFADEPGARLYRTGDLARRRADGQLEFLGRLDSQVKLRGFRIELGEVEAALAAHPKVREATAAVRADASGEPTLVAYVAPELGGAPARADLRGFLARRLPEHMLPSRIVVLEELPRTPNGKIDRNALPAPDGARPELAERYVAPRTSTERLVASVWAELLGVERVGVHDNFFEFGGHSLLATQALARVREALGVEVPLRRLFDGPTVAEVAAALDESPQAAEPVEPIAPSPLRAARAAALAQREGGNGAGS